MAGPPGRHLAKEVALALALVTPGGNPRTRNLRRALIGGRLALDSRPVVVAAFGAASAAVVALRLLVPGVVSSAPDYATSAGTASTWALVVLLLAVAAVATILVRRVPRAAPAALPAVVSAVETSPPRTRKGRGR